MESYKVYKTLQRSPRLFGMDRTIAFEFICALTICILLCFLILGTSVLAVVGVFISIPACLVVFKIRDKRNAIASFKKRRINSRKPKVVKTNPLIILPVESTINKR